MSKTNASLPVGYEALIREFGLTTMPLTRSSFVRRQGGLLVETDGQRINTHYPSRYAPDNEPTAHLEFALKYDGVNLEVLRGVFEQIDRRRLANWVRGRPTSKYTRRTWFLFEWLTETTLDVPDATVVSYVDALGSDYFGANGRASKRHRVRDDLPGCRSFCPLVRRTRQLVAFGHKDLADRVAALVGKHDARLLHRAAQFLYLKETKSSFEIERDHPDRQRTLKFVELLRSAGTAAPLTERTLIALQKDILDRRYAKDAYRSDQNYVGQTLAGYREQVHFVSPRPQDLGDLMQGFLRCAAALTASQIDPVVQAAVLGFGFVFLHPFDDGNGRLHRYLIHHVLSRAGFTPRGLVLPVSAVMLADPRAYDAALESFSRPLLERLDYDLDQRGALTVRNDSAAFYRYFDATEIAEYLYAVVERTIDDDLADELEFLARFDAAWHALREIVDMPDRRLELFIRSCLANRGRLATRKRSQFAEIGDDELEAMERVIRDAGLEDRTSSR